MKKQLKLTPFHNAITEYLLSRDITQAELARILNIRPENIHRWISGQHQPLPLLMCKVIYQLFSKEKCYELIAAMAEYYEVDKCTQK